MKRKMMFLAFAFGATWAKSFSFAIEERPRAPMPNADCWKKWRRVRLSKFDMRLFLRQRLIQIQEDVGQHCPFFVRRLFVEPGEEAVFFVSLGRPGRDDAEGVVDTAAVGFSAFGLDTLGERLCHLEEGRIVEGCQRR